MATSDAIVKMFRKATGRPWGSVDDAAINLGIDTSLKLADPGKRCRNKLTASRRKNLRQGWRYLEDGAARPGEC